MDRGKKSSWFVRERVQWRPPPPPPHRRVTYCSRPGLLELTFVVEWSMLIMSLESLQWRCAAALLPCLNTVQYPRTILILSAPGIIILGAVCTFLKLLVFPKHGKTRALPKLRAVNACKHACVVQQHCAKAKVMQQFRNCHSSSFPTCFGWHKKLDYQRSSVLPVAQKFDPKVVTRMK